MKPTHTPTPWINSGNRIYMGAAIEKREIAVATKSDPSIRTVSDVNAAFIVRAVNSHEELLDFARSVARSACDSQYINTKCICYSCKAKEVIAKAEGRE